MTEVLVDYADRRSGYTLTIRVRNPLSAGYWACISCKGSGERRVYQHLGGDLWCDGIALYRPYSTDCPHCLGAGYSHNPALVEPARLEQRAVSARHFNPRAE